MLDVLATEFFNIGEEERSSSILNSEKVVILVQIQILL